MKKIRIEIFLMILFMSVCSYSQTPFKLKVSAGMTNPVQDFANYYDEGISIEAGLQYSLPIQGLDLTFTTGYNGFKFNYKYFRDEIYESFGVDASNADFDWKITDIPILFGGKYTLDTKGIKPYLAGDIGLHIMSFSERFNGQKVSCSSGSPTTVSYTGAIESATEVGFGASLGPGFEVPFSSTVSLDVSGKYNYSYLTYSKSYIVKYNNSNFVTPTKNTVGFVTIRLGLAINL
jgi:hypothetical protein